MKPGRSTAQKGTLFRPPPSPLQGWSRHVHPAKHIHSITNKHAPLHCVGHAFSLGTSLLTPGATVACVQATIPAKVFRALTSHANALLRKHHAINAHTIPTTYTPRDTILINQARTPMDQAHDKMQTRIPWNMQLVMVHPPA